MTEKTFRFSAGATIVIAIAADHAAAIAAEFEVRAAYIRVECTQSSAAGCVLVLQFVHLAGSDAFKVGTNFKLVVEFRSGPTTSRLARSEGDDKYLVNKKKGALNLKSERRQHSTTNGETFFHGRSF